MGHVSFDKPTLPSSLTFVVEDGDEGGGFVVQGFVVVLRPSKMLVEFLRVDPVVPIH